MIRTTLLLTLLGTYIVVVVRMAGGSGGDGRVDALMPQSRFVEQAMGERRFADALPVALELKRSHGDEPLVAYWLATIFHGLDRPGEEVAAWETYIRLSSAPTEACPAIAVAYERLGDRARSLDHYQRCAGYDPREPDRLVDLGEAWERDQKFDRALAAYHSAVVLDPHNSILVHRIDQLTRSADGAQ